MTSDPLGCAYSTPPAKPLKKMSRCVTRRSPSSCTNLAFLLSCLLLLRPSHALREPEQTFSLRELALGDFDELNAIVRSAVLDLGDILSLIHI